MKIRSSFIPLIILITLSIHTLRAQVAINTSGNSPHSSAMLEIESDSKGLLIPRLTTTQRNTLASSAVDGLLVFDSEEQSFYLFSNTAWIDLSSSANIWTHDASNVYLTDMTKNVGIGTYTPAYTLDVRGINTDDPGIISVSNSDHSHYLLLYSGTDSYSEGSIVWNEGDDLSFGTDQGGWSEKLRITSSGNVGIGTNSPGSKLHINNGNIRLDNSAFLTEFLISNTSSTQWSRPAIHLNHEAPSDDNRDIYLMLENAAAGGGGDANFILRHWRDVSGTYNDILKYTMDDEELSFASSNFNLQTGLLSVSTDNFSGISLTATGTNGREYRITSTDDANGLGGGKLAFYDEDAAAARMIINSEGNVGIGTSNPVESALLELNTIEKGFLPPRMTESQKNSISTPARGLVIYQIDGTPGLFHFNGTEWLAVGAGSSDNHYIGELFGGGIVFYVYDNGQHGLIASLDDLSNGIQWSPDYTTIIPNINGYDGASNTSEIVTVFGAGNTYAAGMCDAYTGGGQTDWYLPAAWELNLLYNASFMISYKLNNDGDGTTNGFPFLAVYWSSTQDGNSNAWSYYFYNGNQNSSRKDYTRRVRAVRRF